MVVLFLVGCGSAATGPGASPDTPAGGSYDDSGVTASCGDYLSWQEAQDALDYDSNLATALDDDYDQVACNELGETEYEEAWPNGYVEACESVFSESPDGTLYLDDVGYEQSECKGTDPGPDTWTADSTSDPEADGMREGWTSACDQFFNGVVGGDLYWGDDVVVSQSDCEYASPY